MVEATGSTGAPAVVAEPTEIIDRARRGDSEAWGEVYRRYAPAIFRFCRRILPTREDAEDATMEIFLKLRDKIRQYDPDRPFSAWLYRVATNHCWDQLRRRNVRHDKETDDIEGMPLQHPDPSQLEKMITERTGTDVRKALATLPARARMALVLRYYAEMSYEEIAEALGVRQAFVGVLLLRARHQLRDAMSAGQAAMASKGNA
ncbi:MAG: sigma-70 family RNA polymerase sigma factor [Candidatus Acidiferrales bacterium]